MSPNVSLPTLMTQIKVMMLTKSLTLNTGPTALLNAMVTEAAITGVGAKLVIDAI